MGKLIYVDAKRAESAMRKHAKLVEADETLASEAREDEERRLAEHKRRDDEFSDRRTRETLP